MSPSNGQTMGNWAATMLQMLHLLAQKLKSGLKRKKRNRTGISCVKTAKMASEINFDLP